MEEIRKAYFCILLYPMPPFQYIVFARSDNVFRIKIWEIGCLPWGGKVCINEEIRDNHHVKASAKCMGFIGGNVKESVLMCKSETTAYISMH